MVQSGQALEDAGDPPGKSSKENAKKQDDGKKASGKAPAAENAKPDTQDEDIPWTEEEDKKIWSLKKKGEAWANIAAEVGKGDKHAVRKRFAELNAAGGMKEESDGTTNVHDSKKSPGKKDEAKDVEEHHCNKPGCRKNAKGAGHADNPNETKEKKGNGQEHFPPPTTHTVGLGWRELNNFIDPAIHRQLAGSSEDQSADVEGGELSPASFDEINSLNIDEVCSGSLEC